MSPMASGRYSMHIYHACDTCLAREIRKVMWQLLLKIKISEYICSNHLPLTRQEDVGKGDNESGVTSKATEASRKAQEK